MNFDNGEVLPGLEKSWTFMGANLMEWASGLMVFLIISIFGESPVRVMPFMLLGAVVTAYGLASLRMMYPDQERGVRNAFMTTMGVVPPNLPAPSSLQPVWSGGRVVDLPDNSKFMELGLADIYGLGETIYEEAE